MGGGMAARCLRCCVAVVYALRSIWVAHAQSLTLTVDAGNPGRQLPPALFGLFFEEINHAGSGGLWAELVQNRGFEAGGPNTPSDIAPWFAVGSEAQVCLGTERSSPFKTNPVALRVEILCDANDIHNKCPDGGVGASNPGFWGMDVRAGATYRVEFWLRSSGLVNLSIAFTSADGSTELAQKYLEVDAPSWSKQFLVVSATSTHHNARLALTSNTRSLFWLDQISAMPTDSFKPVIVKEMHVHSSYEKRSASVLAWAHRSCILYWILTCNPQGHGCRKELALMLDALKPGFLRFPGGSYVEGVQLANAYRWRSSVGPYEQRPGHYNDVWNYWSDDGLGFFELLQLAEDLGALPVWVFNTGISVHEAVSTALIGAFVQDILDGIEFARGPSNSTWGALRAKMGHSEPFQLYYMAVGNQDCGRPFYRGNYMKFHSMIKARYPDIQIISNCDGSYSALDHPADLYDYHVYTSANNLFAMRHQFDHTSRHGPKIFVSEYEVTASDAKRGNLLAGLAEAAFLVGLEFNSDVVHMASYAPLFVNDNDRRFNPDAIVFNSWQEYGTPSYWVQHIFKYSNGAFLLPLSVQADDGTSDSMLVTSALCRHNVSTTGLDYLIVKVVNFGTTSLNVHLVVAGLSARSVQESESNLVILTSANVMDENSFTYPKKVVPTSSRPAITGTEMEVTVPACSIVSLELALTPTLAVM